MMVSVFDRVVENIAWEGENACNEKVFFFKQRFKGFCLRGRQNMHSQLSRTWKNRYRPILPGFFLYRIKKGLCGKTVITSSIFKIENYLK